MCKKNFIFLFLFFLVIINLFSYQVKFIPSQTNPHLIIISDVNAKKVQIAGDWNNWCGTAIDENLSPNIGKLLKNNKGEWFTDVKYLANAKYNFKIIIDGKWQKETYSFEVINSPVKKIGSEITYYNPEANEVIIAGDWNKWAGTENGYLEPALGKMFKDENNIWHYPLTDTHISRGIHKYKFIVNGKFIEGPPLILIIK